MAAGRLELAREDCDSDHLDAVADAHERMATLVDDLTTLARADESLIDVERVALAEAVDTSWQNVETASVELVADTARTVRADEGQLHRVLENLFRNAVTHGQADTIIVGELDEDAGFFVEDDGTGIPPPDRDAIFERGYTTDDTGTGVGLAIVREIVDAHDWEITVREGDAGGARFEIVGLSA